MKNPPDSTKTSKTKMTTDRLRIAWLTTGRGPGSYGALEYLLNAIDAGLPVELAVVFCNRDEGESEATDSLLSMVRKRGIALETRSSVAFRKANGGSRSRPGEPLPAWRDAYDRAVAEQLSAHNFDVGIMFGYMLIATAPLYERYTFLNDHPALPDGPIGTYQEVIRELIRRRATESGCMMNIVTGDVDRGAVVSYCRFSIRDDANASLWGEVVEEDGPLFANIRARGVARERPFVVETLRAIAERRIKLPPHAPVDLTGEVEAMLGSGTSIPR